MKKKVHRSKLVKILTIVLMTILIAVDIYLIIQMAARNGSYTLNAILILIITATIIGSYGYAPISVHLTDSAFILCRGVGKKVINYADIAVVDIYNHEGASIRVCGIGGIFGFIGKFYNKSIGNYFSYVGDYSQAIYMQLKNGRKYVFSCTDREYVVFFIKKKLEHL